MRSRFSFLAALAACLLPVWAAVADETASIAEVKAAVAAIEQAFADQDLATIERAFTPDHISIATRYGGPVRLPEQFATVDALERKTFDVTPYEVRLIGDDAAMVTYEQSYSGTYDGEPLPPRVVVSQIWLKEDGAWKQLLYQETPIAQP